MRIVVDLPAPLGPRKPNTSPLCTFKLIWSTATNSPNRFISFSMMTESELSEDGLPARLLSAIARSSAAYRIHKQVFNRRLNLFVDAVGSGGSSDGREQ